MTKDPQHTQPLLRVALAGNPNAGKTTFFNALTGTRQHVGNYPGVTVEKVEGMCSVEGGQICFTDLPGTYDLSSCSPEESVSRDFLFYEKPDAVVNVVDASNLERNLYLTLRLLEMGVPLVIALNMSDKAEAEGLHIDSQKLSPLLGGVPVLKTVASQGEGKRELLTLVGKVAQQAQSHAFVLDYGPEVEHAVGELMKVLEKEDPALAPHQRRWIALNLLAGDVEMLKAGRYPQARALAESLSKQITSTAGRAMSELLAEARYRFILNLCKEAVQSTSSQKRTWTSILDGVLTSRRWGLPIFLVLMYLVFTLTFTLGEPFMGWIESGTLWLHDGISSLWAEGSESFLKSLLLDGILAGVGGVLVFLPNIVLLFLAISILEDSGYMARAACLLDNVMSRFGLHGKSFIPLLIGFGCTVPAVISTRIIENKADRFTTILVLPLFSCGARLPIYALVIPAFFAEEWRGPVLWLIYCIGIVAAVVLAKILGLSLFKGMERPFVMELPSYQMPTLMSLLMTIWHRSWLYLKKAGTIILMTSIVLWAATQWPVLSAEQEAQYDARIAAVESGAGMDQAAQAEAIEGVEKERASALLEASLMGHLGKGLETFLSPCGFDWKISTALLAGLAAKELVVSQLGIVFALGEADENSDSLRSKLSETYSPLQGFCIMLFCLLSAPCFATLAIVKQECGGWQWALGQFLGLFLLAWCTTCLVYQIGSRLF